MLNVNCKHKVYLNKKETLRIKNNFILVCFQLNIDSALARPGLSYPIWVCFDYLRNSLKCRKTARNLSPKELTSIFVVVSLTRMMSKLINAVQRAKKRRQNTATASFIRRPAMENMTVLSANPKRKHRKTNFHKNPSRRWFWSKKTPISTLIRMKWSTAAMGKQLLRHSGPEASKFQRKSAIGFAS